MRMKSAHYAIGWGYEGKSLDNLIVDAQAWGVVRVVDVRLNPVSRKPGFSKRRLHDGLASAGVGYVHVRELGNPRDNREGFADVDGDKGHEARSRYSSEVLATETARAALQEVLEFIEDGPVIILCYEAIERCCHRSLVLDALRERKLELVNT